MKPRVLRTGIRAWLYRGTHRAPRARFGTLRGVALVLATTAALRVTPRHQL